MKGGQRNQVTRNGATRCPESREVAVKSVGRTVGTVAPRGSSRSGPPSGPEWYQFELSSSWGAGEPGSYSNPLLPPTYRLFEQTQTLRESADFYSERLIRRPGRSLLLENLCDAHGESG